MSCIANLSLHSETTRSAISAAVQLKGVSRPWPAQESGAKAPVHPSCLGGEALLVNTSRSLTAKNNSSGRYVEIHFRA